MRRKSEPGGRAGLAPKPTTHPLFFLLLLVMTSDKSSPPPPPPLPICFRRRGQANNINPLAPPGNKFWIDTCIAIPNLNKSLLLLYLVEHSYADYCLTYYSNNINTYYMYCADGCCGYSHDRKCCTKIKYDFSASNYNL